MDIAPLTIAYHYNKKKIFNVRVELRLLKCFEKKIMFLVERETVTDLI